MARRLSAAGFQFSEDEDAMRKTASIGAPVSQRPGAVPTSRTRRHTVAGPTPSLGGICRPAEAATIESSRASHHERSQKIQGELVSEVQDVVTAEDGTATTPRQQSELASEDNDAKPTADGAASPMHQHQGPPKIQGDLSSEVNDVVPTVDGAATTPRHQEKPVKVEGEVASEVNDVAPTVDGDASPERQVVTKEEIGKTCVGHVASEDHGRTGNEEPPKEIASLPTVGKKRKRVKLMLARAFGERALRCFDHRRSESQP